LVLGDELLKLAADAKHELILCAPFAKQGVVQRILTATQDSVSIEVVTRWRPEEIAAGVSDTEVLAAVEGRGGLVLLHDRLHAKYYRNESRVLVGSANLTATALGWSPNPNLELLSQVSLGEIEELEQRLRAEAIQATVARAVEVETAALLLGSVPAVESSQLISGEEWVRWVPTLRIPDDLFLAYNGKGRQLSTASQSAAARDLIALDIPSGLGAVSFAVVVGHRLLQQPVIRDLDDFLVEARRFGEVRDFLQARLSCDRDEAETSWQTLMRWLICFLPDRFVQRTPNWSEMFQRVSGGDG
jgi:hypothetical protein